MASGFDISGMGGGAGFGGSGNQYKGTRFMDDYLDDQDQRSAYEIEKRDTEPQKRAYELSAMYRQGSSKAKSPSLAGELGKTAAGAAVGVAVKAGIALI